MDIYTGFASESLYLERANESYIKQLSDKDTNEDSDEERNHCWDSHGSLEPVLREIKHQGNKKLKN